MRQHRKKKKRNQPGRKPKEFAEVVNLITRDSLLTMEEMNAGKEEPTEVDEQGRAIVMKHDLPEDSVVVDTLNGCWAYKKARLDRHVETMKIILNEFSDAFFEKENGETIMDLRKDKKGRVWAADLTIMGLCYTAIAMGLAVWPYPRREWSALPEGMPYIRFLKPGQNNFNKVEGSTNEQSIEQRPN